MSRPRNSRTHFSGDVRFRAIVPSQRYGCTWPIGGDPRCAVLRSRKHVRGVNLAGRGHSAVIKRVQAEPCVHLAGVARLLRRVI